MNHAIGLVTRFILASVLVFVGTMLIGGAVFAAFGNPWSDIPEAGDVFVPMLVSSALLVLALVAPLQVSSLPRWQRITAAFLACLGVNVLLMQIEAAAFLDMTTAQLLAALTQSTLVAAWLCLVTGWLFGSRDWRGSSDPATASMARGALVKRVLVCAGAYLLLYLVAGMAIYGQVADYYAEQNFEPGPWIVPLAFVRGALYVVFSLWLIRSMNCSRFQCALAIAVMFPLLAGVAALVMPNAFMPPDVRFWHAIEVGVSNFLFGFLVGWLFWRDPQARVMNAKAPAGSVHAA